MIGWDKHVPLRPLLRGSVLLGKSFKCYKDGIPVNDTWIPATYSREVWVGCWLWAIDI